MRDYKLISCHYSIKINKRIPVFGGLGGGTSNAATILKFLIRKKIKKNILSNIIKYVGSDLRLFDYDQGHLENLKKVVKLRSKKKLYFLLVFPKIKCSTKYIYSKVKSFSNKKKFLQNRSGLNALQYTIHTCRRCLWVKKLYRREMSQLRAY